MVVAGCVSASAVGLTLASTGATAGTVPLPQISRIAGIDRYDTAVQASQATFSPGADVAYLATGVTFPDALAASAASGGHGPVLLSPPNALPETVASELARLHPARLVVVGGPASVGDAVLAAAAAASGAPAS
ncbi:MAG: N-acetylmuramoyl-L-alanine amidase family 2, partial [Acidimicrobiales bacterium]|nr:N-acetylmuramoyl-L-alanine amidase family 2 [Acidimicrobiales bacterium]